ncbi:MAG TPA: hypothetical protein VGM80_12970 [Gaiellaceae bacterium]
MRVRVGDPLAVGELGEFLRERTGAIVERTRPGEMEVLLVGSFSNVALREAIELAVSRWRFVSRRAELSVVVG